MEGQNGIEGHTDRRQVGLVSLDGGPLVGWSQGSDSQRPVKERDLLCEQAAVQHSSQQREPLSCAQNNWLQRLTI